jgi:hypothetical protein
MGGFLADAVNNRVLDCFFGGVAIFPPDSLLVGLSRSLANKYGCIIEPEGGGYGRVTIDNDFTTFDRSRSGSKRNNEAIAFHEPTGDWGSIRSVFLADEETGQVIAMADLPTPREIKAGDSAPIIGVGGLFLSHN